MKRVLCLILLSCLCITSYSASREEASSTRYAGKVLKASPYQAEDHHIIHIGIFYTQDLLESMSVEDINDYVQRQIDAANHVLENSELAIRREVNYIGEYPSANQPNLAINDFLATVFNAENETVRDLAQQHGFDYITILRPHKSASYCGWAYYNSPYAVMEIGGNCTSPTLGAHEWGHNDGADHDIANSSDLPARHYGRGYNCGGEGTIMSTSNNWFNRHNFYSTPDKSVNGEVCGETSSANVVRMLNELKELPNHLGNRNDIPEKLAYIVFDTIAAQNIEEGGSVNVTLKLVDEDNNGVTLGRPVSVELYTEANSAIADRDYEATTKRVEFVAGASTIEVSIKTLTDTEQEDTESFTLSLRYADIAVASELSKVIHILNNNAGINFSVSDNSVSIREGESHTFEVNRLGNTDAEAELLVSESDSWLSLSTEKLNFMSGQTSLTFTVQVDNISTSRQGQIIITPQGTAQQPLTIEINAVDNTEPQVSNSGGGSVTIPFALLLFLLSVYRQNAQSLNRQV